MMISKTPSTRTALFGSANGSVAPTSWVTGDAPASLSTPNQMYTIASDSRSRIGAIRSALTTRRWRMWPLARRLGSPAHRRFASRSRLCSTH